jgi:hypothetical protein
MLVFQLFTLQLPSENINLIEKTITIRPTINYLYLTLSYDTEQYSISKHHPETVYDWKKFISLWLKTLKEDTKIFNIDFEKLELNIDYVLAPVYITNTITIIGIFLINHKNTITTTITTTNTTNTKITYHLLSSIKPCNYKNKLNYNKYNLFYGILDRDKDKDTTIQDNTQKFILDTSLNTMTDIKTKTKLKTNTNTNKKITIPLKRILQNSMNYLPKLEIKLRKTSQNLLNP